MANVEYTTKSAEQAIEELDFREDTRNIKHYIQKKVQNNDIFKTINGNSGGSSIKAVEQQHSPNKSSYKKKTIVCFFVFA